MKNILCLSGSTRINSTSMEILKTIGQRHATSANFERYASLALLPHFDPDAENAILPRSILKLREAITAADAVIICTPEYVFSPPAVLKNAIEWCVASTAFSDKPTALIVASGLGEKTVESLSLILKTVQAKLLPETTLHLKGVRSQISVHDGIQDSETLQKLDALFLALCSAI